MEFDLDYLVAQMPALWRGLLVTLRVTGAAIVLSVVLGVLGAVIRHFRIPVLSPIVWFYVELIRNTPLLVQIFFIFYGLPAIGMTLSLFWSGVLALVLWAGAFQVENVRGGLASVNKGLWEAGSALGVHRGLFMVLVALPLAVRVCLPAMLNTSISLLKNSSFLQAIGLAELTFVAVDRIAMDFRLLEMFASLFVVYLGLVFLFSFAVGRLEAHLQRPFRV
jgi:polar amino acid transport system permease protein